MSATTAKRTELARITYKKPELARAVGLSIRSLNRAIAAETFPPNDLILNGTRLWSASLVSRWLAGEPVKPKRGR